MRGYIYNYIYIYIYIYIHVYVQQNTCTLLRASATYCVGVAERSGGNDLPRSQTPYLYAAFKRSGYALARTIEK